jgi:ABC-type transport system involved in multi-copper enzyme maturation permease subunit
MVSTASQLMHRFSFGAGAPEASNLAISAVFLAVLATAAFVGTALVRIDLERGTLALMLAQPIGLGSYVLGRFTGLVAATCVVAALAAAGIGAALELATAPEGTFSAALLVGWLRVAFAVPVLAAMALAASAAASRVFAPVLFLALFLAGDIAGASALSRVLPAFGTFGLDVARSPSLAWLGIYSLAYSVVFLAVTYLQLALRPPTTAEN